MQNQSEQNEYNRKLIEEFRAYRGKAENPMTKRPLLLLTTTGAKSGQSRTVPIMYVPDGNRLLVIASNAGAPKHPSWYYNLLAHPEVTVEVGNEVYEATATVLDGAEREHMWESITKASPFFIEHQAKVTRQIPVIALVRRES